MGFDIQGFSKAAKGMGYSDQDINAISGMFANKPLSIEDEAKRVSLDTAKLNYATKLDESNITPEQKEQDTFNLWKKKEDYTKKQSQLETIYKEEKETEKKERVVKDLDMFEKNYLETGLRGKLLGWVPSGTGLSPEAADFDAQRGILAYTLAKAIADQKGQGVSNKDIERWTNALPSRSNTAAEATNKMNNLRQQVANSLGIEATTSTIKTNKGEPLPQVTGGTVVMTGPDGKKWNVPKDKVNTFKQNGYK